MDAFAASLEELVEADLILHVVDAGAVQIDEQIEAVRGILRQLGVDQKPTITVFNKMDLAKSSVLHALTRQYGGVAVSALSRNTLHPLIRAMEAYVEALRPEISPVIEQDAAVPVRHMVSGEGGT